MSVTAFEQPRSDRARRILLRPSPPALGSLREAGYHVTRVLGSPGARDVLRRIDAGECWCTYECVIQSSLLFRPRKYPGLFRGLW